MKKFLGKSFSKFQFFLISNFQAIKSIWSWVYVVCCIHCGILDLKFLFFVFTFSSDFIFLISNFFLDFQAIKSVKSAEFMPFVVFIAAPSVEILRNMYELGKMEGWTTKTYTVRYLHSSVLNILQDFWIFSNISDFQIFKEWYYSISIFLSI